MKIFETSPPSDFVPARGKGCWLWDMDGKRYLDLLAEFALKAARIAANRSEIIGFGEGYYGATGSALAL
jgi:4-aminobutyrate aminotransferase-like enzyme